LLSTTGSLFVGKRDDCLAFISRLSNPYVYVLRRPDGRPFYVGKGSGPRVFNHENEARHPNGRRSNSHKLNVIRAIWRASEDVIYEINGEFASDELAYIRETELISAHKRLHEGGTLTNRAPGGGSTAGLSPFSRDRHSQTLGGIPADDIETATLNRFVLAIGPMRSVILKPRSRFSPKPTQPYPSKKTGPSLRQAIAIAASASANGIILSPGVSLPRTVVIDDIAAFVENGVCCDLATSGMATIIPASSPERELLQLDESQVRSVIGYIGLKKAKDLGIA
jgi:hypothetical protein